MSWNESYTESKTRRLTRPSRPKYVPRHIRNNPINDGDVSFTVTIPQNIQPFGFADESAHRFNRFDRPSPSRGRGRGYGRGRGGGRSWGRPGELSHDPIPNLYPSSNSSSFDVEKFDELEVIEDPLDGGINFDAYEDIPVETSGLDIPPPANSFAEIDLGKALNDNIKRCKYVKPTPVQRHAIPMAMAGRDLMACAQTGSGKTAAFCFPIICGIIRSHLEMPQLSNRRSSLKVAYPLALILSPTRELSCQIYEEAKKFSYQTGVKVGVAYGGAPIAKQLHNLERGVDILVATPGRLADMVERAKVSLSKIKYLVLDEADRMLDMGFEPQIRKIVEQMEMPLPGARQTMLFSATFPTEIQKLASDFLSNYIFLAVGKVGSSTDLIVQRVEFVQDIDKRKHLMRLLCTQKANGTHGKHALTLIFVETKKGADALENWLSMKGFPSIAIHGDKVQLEREQALRSFKTGVTPILVATDVASRGLDIPHVAHVINFDLPKDIADYVHRIGRTGRAGKSGLATAFFSDKNLPLARALVELMQEANQEVPSWLSQYSESYGRRGGPSNRYGGSKFGGHDFRSGSYLRGDDSYYSSQHAETTLSSFTYAAPFVNDYSSAGPVDANLNAAGPYGYGFNVGSVVASGWE